MRRHWFVAVVAALIASNVLIAAQSPTASSGQTARAARPAPARQVPVATIKEIMDGIVDPTADVIFDSVLYTATAAGVEEKMPRTRDEWAEVRRHALLLVEVTNLLMMPGRRVAPDHPIIEFEREDPSPEDLTPEQIQALIDEDPAKFRSLAEGLRDAAKQALAAVDAMSVDKLFESGDAIDQACEHCHLQYWYPKDKRPAAAALSRRNKNR